MKRNMVAVPAAQTLFILSPSLLITNRAQFKICRLLSAPITENAYYNTLKFRFNTIKSTAGRLVGKKKNKVA